MLVRYHLLVQRDLNEILAKYSLISERLSDDFLGELVVGIGKARANPRIFHFDSSGLRRCNLSRFPYHFLYDIHESVIRIWVVRHDHRSPGFGVRRFKK